MRTTLLLSRSYALRFLVLALSLAPQAVRAQNSPNHFTLGARLSFNISAEFKSEGIPASLPDPSLLGGGIDRLYDDGYVGIDADNNAAGLTWYWGYRDPAQITPEGNLALHITSLGPAKSGAFADAPQPGLEFSWLRELRRTDRATIGFKLAFNFADVSVEDRGPGSASFRRLTDTYSLGGIVPPGDPALSSWQYQATRDQGLFAASPLIGDVPATRAIDSSGAALITGSRSIDASVFGWKLGPWLEFPITKRVSVGASAGVSWAVLDSEFRFNEALSFPGGGSLAQRGSDTKTDAVLGGFAEVNLNFAITTNTRVFVGGEFQHLEEFQQRSGSRKATLDLGQTWSLLAGFGFSF